MARPRPGRAPTLARGGRPRRPDADGGAALRRAGPRRSRRAARADRRLRGARRAHARRGAWRSCASRTRAARPWSCTATRATGGRGPCSRPCLVGEGMDPVEAIDAHPARPARLDRDRGAGDRGPPVRPGPRRARTTGRRRSHVSDLRVALVGAKGRMGQVIGPGLEKAEGVALVARIDLGDDLVAALPRGPRGGRGRLHDAGQRRRQRAQDPRGGLRRRHRHDGLPRPPTSTTSTRARGPRAGASSWRRTSRSACS